MVRWLHPLCAPDLHSIFEQGFDFAEITLLKVQIFDSAVSLTLRIHKFTLRYIYWHLLTAVPLSTVSMITAGPAPLLLVRVTRPLATFFFIFAPPHHFFSLTCSRLRISATKRHHGTVASLIYLYIIFYSAVSMTLRNFLHREMETQCENQTWLTCPKGLG